MCKRVWIAWVNPRQAVVSVPRFFLFVRNNEDSASVKQNTQIPSKLNEQKDKNKSAKIITPTNEIIRRLRKSWVKVDYYMCNNLFVCIANCLQIILLRLNEWRFQTILSRCHISTSGSFKGTARKIDKTQKSEEFNFKFLLLKMNFPMRAAQYCVNL